MRTILIVTGLIFLILGGLLYFTPIQTPSVSTTTFSAYGDNSENARVSYATFSVPIQIIMSTLIIGAVLMVLGVILPSPYGRDVSDVTITKHIERKGRKKPLIRRRRVVRGRTRRHYSSTRRTRR